MRAQRSTDPQQPAVPPAEERLHQDMTLERITDQSGADQEDHIEVTVDADGVYTRELERVEPGRTTDWSEVRDFDGSTSKEIIVEVESGTWSFVYSYGVTGDGSGTVTRPDGSTCPIEVRDRVCTYTCEGSDPLRC